MKNVNNPLDITRYPILKMIGELDDTAKAVILLLIAMLTGMEFNDNESIASNAAQYLNDYSVEDDKEYRSIREALLKEEKEDICSFFKAVVIIKGYYDLKLEELKCKELKDELGVDTEFLRHLIDGKNPNPRQEKVLILCNQFKLYPKAAKKAFRLAGYDLESPKLKAFKSLIPLLQLSTYTFTDIAKEMGINLTTKERKAPKFGKDVSF
ncbi:MAG: hypothetical protein IJ746_03445 [Ruminococcus sp.]|nr:hypothetical protein [Ruminococcus sp.]